MSHFPDSIQVLLVKEGRQYAALCLDYNVSGCGRTPKRALCELLDMVETYCGYYLDQGEEPPLRPVSKSLLKQWKQDLKD